MFDYLMWVGPRKNGGGDIVSILVHYNPMTSQSASSSHWHQAAERLKFEGHLAEILLGILANVLEPRIDVFSILSPAMIISYVFLLTGMFKDILITHI